MLGLQSGDRALVVCVHPDDETLGMAGTIAALVSLIEEALVTTSPAVLFVYLMVS